MNLLFSNKKYLPGYVPPLKNELLSSWLFRLSIQHKMKPISFTRFYFKNNCVGNRDIDKYINDDLLNSILKYTPLKEMDVKMMMLTSYENVLYKGELKPAYTLGITNLGIYSTNRKGNGLLLCSKCIINNEYFRKEWRLHTSLVCLECNNYLIDKCPNCNSPIAFQRLSIGDKDVYSETPVYYCWNCKYDYRKIDLPIIDNQLIIDYQNYINNTIELGYNRHTQYSFFYFETLFLFFRRIKTNSILWNRVREGFIKKYKINHDEIYIRDQYYSSLEFRIIILPLIFKLLENWPFDFIDFCKSNNIRYSDLCRFDKDIPFLVIRIFKEFF